MWLKFRLNSDAWINWQEDSSPLSARTPIGLAMDIPPNIYSPGIPMYKVMFPEESKLSNVYWWSRDSRYITLGDFLNMTRLGSPFLCFDKNRWVLYDYCITKSPG